MESKYKSIEWYEDRLEEFQELQCLALTFCKKFENELSKDFIDKYNKHFNLVRLSEGKINKSEKYSDTIKSIEEFISNGGIKIRSPYPTENELEKARLENPGYIVYGGYGVINLMKIPE